MIKQRYSLVIKSIPLIIVLSGCGGEDGLTQDDGTNNGSTQNEGNTSGITLETKYPVSDDTSLPSFLDQSFACADDASQYLYELVATSDGNISAIDPNGGATLDSGSYTISGTDLNISFNTYYSGFKTSAFRTAGDLLLGFKGTDSNGTTLYCGTFKHSFSEKVTSQTNVYCESRDKGFNSAYDLRTDSFEFYADGSSTHTYQYKGNISPSGSPQVSYGSHLYNANTGQISTSYIDSDTGDLFAFTGSVDSNSNIAMDIDRQGTLTCTLY